MKNNKTLNLKNIALLALITISSVENSNATTVTYNFTASDFYPNFIGVPSPINSISGSYTLDEGALTAIDLTIGSHTYSLNEVAYEYINSYPTYDLYLLGATYNGIGGMTGSTNDFWLGEQVTPEGIIFENFTYAIPSIRDPFSAANGTITIAPSPVPLASGAWFFISGLVGVSGAFRRHT